MVSPNTMSHDSKEATREAAQRFAARISRIQCEMFKLIIDGAPQELVQLVFVGLMDTAIDTFVSQHTLLLDDEDSRIPVPSCN